MVSTASIPRQELVNSAGQAFAYIVSADEMEKLKNEVVALREQVVRLEERRRMAEERLMQMDRLLTAPPMSEEQWQAVIDNPDPGDVAGLIAKLRAES